MGNFNRDNRPSGGRGDGGFGRRDFGRRDFGGGKPTMHRVTCSDCGKECEVPFRPTGERPVFCNDCFRNHRDAGPSRFSGGNSNQYKEQFEAINFKLDKILKILTPEEKIISKKKK